MDIGRPEMIHIPYRGRWTYSRTELIVDGVVHLVGIVSALIAGAVLLSMSFVRTGTGEFVAATFYVLALLAVLTVSLLYNQWPVSPGKWLLRRVDHSMIYVLIAATYTPFLAQLPDTRLAVIALLSVWVAAGIGMAIKLCFPGRFDRLAILFYLATGWSGIALAGPLIDTLPSTTLHLIVAGGAVYTAGVFFYLWSSLKFHTAMWHGFVVGGAALHCSAVIDCLVLNRL